MIRELWRFFCKTVNVGNEQRERGVKNKEGAVSLAHWAHLLWANYTGYNLLISWLTAWAGTNEKYDLIDRNFH